MGKKTPSEDSIPVGKDSRRAKKREEEARAHHIWYESTGPNVIIRSQIGAVKTSFEAEDLFDVTCDNVAHSLNKGRRWEKADNAEQILHKQNSSGKTSFVKASVPGFPNRNLICNTLTDHNDGVNKYIEVEDGEMSVRNAKSNRANLTSLQTTVGPGPRLKANRHRNHRGKEDESGTLSDPSEDRQHTRYSAIEVQKRNAKAVERSWRICQHQRSQKQGWTRKPTVRDDDDWRSDDQAALEDELDELYEEQIDSEEPLRLPHMNTAEKQPASIVKNEKCQATEVILQQPEEYPKVLSEKEIKKIEKGKTLAKMKEDEYRDQFINLRPALTSTLIKNEVYVKAREYFYKMKEAECLPVFPRTIIVHKGDSESLLGRCNFIAASNIAGEVDLFAAPRFCCTFTTPEPIEGWQSYARNESDAITTVRDSIEPTSSLDECPLCKKTEEKEELTDTVLIEHPHLFSFSCGHLACHDCWIAHAKQNSRDRTTSITCVNSNCNHISTVSEAAALFSDGTIDMFREFNWDLMSAQTDSVTCHSCSRLLVPDKTNYSATALCNCGARTCRRCGIREHLPITCSAYKEWAYKISPYGPYNYPSFYYTKHPYRRHTQEDKDAFINCGQCGAENGWRWKQWCEKCLAMRWHSEDYSMFPKKDHIVVLEARGKLMNGDYRQVKIDRNLLHKEKASDMERNIEEGVCLIELIKISRLMKESRILSTRKGKMALEQYELESSLESILFAAMEAGDNAEKKIDELKKKIDAIRQEYSESITILSIKSQFTIGR